MIEEISAFFTTEMIYMWLNIGVLPFWFSLIFFPESKICNYLTTSIIPIFIFAIIYSYLIYLFFMTDYDFLGSFKLYFGLSQLQVLFNDIPFVLLFWIHFLAINLFCGCWIVKDSQRFSISKYILFIPLIITYFVGPLGILLYWLIKVVRANKISLYD